MKRTALVLGAMALVMALYWPSVQSLLRYWNDTHSLTYTHGYLIALISLGLILQARARIAAAPINPKPLAILGVLMASIAWLVAYHSAIQVGYQILLPVLMWGTVYAVFGWPIARLCSFPLAYLYFAVPFWDSANALPQWGTVFAVRLMLRAIGVPAYFSENYVQIPQGTFEIAGGCSGLHFFIVALALAVLLGKLRRDRLSVRIQLAALAIVLALVANWVRVFTIIVAGYLTDMQHYLVRVNHYYYGWVLFAAAMAAFFFIARRIGEEPAPESLRTNGPTAPPAMGKVWAASAATLAAVALPVAWAAMNTAKAGRYSHLELLPKPPAGWSGPAAVSDGWKPKFENADRFAQGLYAQDGAQVEAATAVYDFQRQGKELGGYGNSVAGTLKSEGTSQVEVSGRPFVELNAQDDAGRSWIVWYGYEVGARWFTNATRAQVWYGVRSLAGSQLSRAWVLRSQCIPDCDSARRALRSFTEQGVIE